MKASLLLFIGFIFISFTSAVTLNDTLITSNGLNSTINVSNFSITFDKLVVSSSYIAFYNLTYLNPLSCYGLSNYSFYNFTQVNITKELPTNCNPITITNPTTADENSNPVNLRVTTTELSTCAYSLDSQANVSMGTNTGFLVPITLSNGVHTIKVFCNDAFGNKSDFKSISFNVYLGGGGSGDTTDPIVNETNQTIINNTIIGNESEVSEKLFGLSIWAWIVIWIIIGFFCFILILFIIDLLKKRKIK